MRFCLMILLLGSCLAAQADKIRLLREAPQECEEKSAVSVSSGSKMRGMLFSDARIDRHVNKKLTRAIKKAGGNRAMLSDRREFMMENHFRGIEHIELDAWVWHCEEKER
ncbi:MULTISPECIES: hypothetical protein [Alcanivorax]|jgi:hypothetical protein|uniref:Lipoprotein n=1 Tax=Alcanivorax borkumensis (strain ATCC 700651 / DSM 11573 / NCIMB 13689 / SK2) TaxID=393595 RepID=Q0VLJ6_ALCBS|nr:MULTISPECIES: hypothetical protein [Alcanivorax]EUC71012.1 hypothetical protein Y017_08605 [Alcanivorax sp. 97CO-5]PKG02538.1 hypothetical protein Y019_04395 [Alcanivorax sp. 97CO-6]BAP15403.1 hypothetical protein AS19_25520 [Alcanivorax sp. NBRC 101098]CAL17952.1 hypothetical protein ABO_2504 [Alcanivorax borkumensis SK2]